MPLFRRRPLLRAAAVGGGAYMMGKRHAEAQNEEAYQNQRLNDLESQPRPQASSGGVSQEVVDRLGQLGQLHDQGVLTDGEFAEQKQKLLAG